MSWIVLLLAGAFEVVWAVGLKVSEGFTRPIASLTTVLAMAVSVVLLAMAMRSLPLGTAYAVWTGIGAIGAFTVGVVWFAEPLTPARVLSAGLIVAGIVGLKLSSA
ncbi:quaternary ammonium compound efflux SMR transporter SugE [Alkalisalibacterium limincola]|uniref:Guanidinium exporter n=1 Tax=Alkalisalibacterium limincola TaxID=2699169 RepID=A0A5C8KPJ8_9GAMM|nr:quaternary ammonium compound efflux SMR transporter SugE [Alkalisalibacterium limincola]TXK62084.1 quaternary ammonium compound efflux SMR transporter SugE [Alkalisalibacterium limincola]